MSGLPKSARVAIVGGGVVGLAVAHHLARLGEPDVVLLERENLLGTGSSGASAGGLRQQFAEEANVVFAMEGVRQILALEAETGHDPEFRRHGYLLLATTAERIGELAQNVELQNRLGLPSEILEPAEVARRWPVLRTDDLAGAAFCGSDGYCDPHAILTAFAETARRAGIRIETGVAVAALELKSGAVVGVETAAGPIRAETTVVAGGPWSGELLRTAGLDLPLSPRRRQIFATHPFPFPRDLPLVIDMDRPFYFRPEGGGVILSAAEAEETRDFDLAVDETGLGDLVERAVHRCPSLESATIARGWAGLRTLTPDGSAILGHAPGAPGLVLAVGFSGHGITHAPAVGRALAELILDGETSLPLDAFRADRFGGPAPPRAGAVAG